MKSSTSPTYKISVEKRLTQLQDGQNFIKETLTRHIESEDDMIQRVAMKLDQFYWVFVGGLITMFSGVVIDFILRPK